MSDLMALFNMLRMSSSPLLGMARFSLSRRINATSWTGEERARRARSLERSELFQEVRRLTSLLEMGEMNSRRGSRL